MTVSYAKLKGKIKEMYNTQIAFAEAMGMSAQLLSFKLNNKTNWKREEIETACALLSIPIEDVYIYFFK